MVQTPCIQPVTVQSWYGQPFLVVANLFTPQCWHIVTYEYLIMHCSSYRSCSNLKKTENIAALPPEALCLEKESSTNTCICRGMLLLQNIHNTQNSLQLMLQAAAQWVNSFRFRILFVFSNKIIHMLCLRYKTNCIITHQATTTIRTDTFGSQNERKSKTTYKTIGAIVRNFRDAENCTP